MMINQVAKAGHPSAKEPTVVFPGRRYDPFDSGPTKKGSGRAKELPCKRSGLCSLGEVKGHVGDISGSE